VSEGPEIKDYLHNFTVSNRPAKRRNENAQRQFLDNFLVSLGGPVKPT
jgi:hypothetical protein